ncbi:MAG TPA: redoxin domain-containing protein [Spirochaetota bacterium]|nr:redoxin domain-containing protein [Spirochaetota bacterium]HPO45525.1 redoxin domain-containing protein [Spirochaetota bacterium]HPV98826.1 redoxin domain-containing protein [Spirochaetota bacterium]
MKNKALLLIYSTIIAFAIGCGGAPEKAPEAVQNAPFPIIGTKIPAAELDAFHKGALTTVKLSSYKGKWLILFFYPADFSFVCPTELTEMAERYEDYKKAGAEVLAISTDSALVHRAWAEHHEGIGKIRFPMLSDRNGRLSRAMGVYVDDKGTALRASFVVDPDGTVIAAETHDDSIGRSAAELLRKLEAAVAVRASKGGFCPASWGPGEELITPK